MNCNYFTSLNLYKNSSDSPKFNVKKWLNKKSFNGFFRNKNRIFLVPQHGSALDLLWGGESQLPQTPVAFKFALFSVIIEQLIQTQPFSMGSEMNW